LGFASFQEITAWEYLTWHRRFRTFKKQWFILIQSPLYSLTLRPNTRDRLWYDVVVAEPDGIVVELADDESEAGVTIVMVVLETTVLDQAPAILEAIASASIVEKVGTELDVP
jgi:hypothetical protein